MFRHTWAILTGEYPPQPGGVSDYTRLVARGLAEQGDEVHVWVPRAGLPPAVDAGVDVHLLPDHFGLRSLLRLSADLKHLPSSSRLLVQYVPQAFGWRGMNVPFCLWLWWHGRRRRDAYVMFHEVVFPLAWRQPLRHNLLALVTRLMARLLLDAADRVFVSTTSWTPLLKRLGLRKNATWLPIPPTALATPNACAAKQIREKIAPGGEPVVGHFGTYGQLIGPMVEQAVRDLLARRADVRILLLGRGSEAFAKRFGDDRVTGTGGLDEQSLADHVAAVDVFVQPYPDGISTRRSSAVTLLAQGVAMVTNEGHLTDEFWRGEGREAVKLVERAEQCAEAGLAMLSRGDRCQMHAASAGVVREALSLSRTIDSLRTVGAQDRR